MSSERRRVLFINKRFQLPLIGYFVALSFLAEMVFYFANNWFFRKFSQIGKDLNLPADHAFYELIANQKYQMQWIFLWGVLISTTILLIGGAYMSHRIAGPIYRLCQHLKAINEGKNPGPLHFREKDFFPEIQDHLNPLLDKYFDKGA